MPFDPADSPVDSVRFLLGDTQEPFLLSDLEIQFALDQNPNLYRAASVCARTVATRFARRGHSKFETLETDHRETVRNFDMMARSLEQQAKRNGGMGVPVAGGISRADIENARNDPDRVKPFFYDNWGNNPPPSNE